MSRFSVTKRNMIFDKAIGKPLHVHGQALKALKAQMPDDNELLDAIDQAISFNPSRMAGDKIKQSQMTTTTKPKNRYEVVDTEEAIINLMRPDIHPRLINQGTGYRGIDATTDLGPIDIQYRGFQNAPIDLISAARFGPKARRDIDAINTAIAQDVYDGAKAQDILNQLQSPSGLDMTMLKPGKVLNSSEYPRVASMYHPRGGGYSRPVVYDLNVLSQMLKDTPLRDLGLGFKFNRKARGSSASAHLDRHESAYLLPNRMDQLADAIITDQFFI